MTEGGSTQPIGPPRRRSALWSAPWIPLAGALTLLALVAVALLAIPHVWNAVQLVVDRQPPSVSLEFEVDGVRLEGLVVNGVRQEGLEVTVPPGAPVRVFASVTDDCDPAPRLRLQLSPDVLVQQRADCAGAALQDVAVEEVLPLPCEGWYHLLVDVTDRSGNGLVFPATIRVSSGPQRDAGGAVVREWSSSIDDAGALRVDGDVLYWAPGDVTRVRPSDVSATLMREGVQVLSDALGAPARIMPTRTESDARGFAVLHFATRLDGPFTAAPKGIWVIVRSGATNEPGVGSNILLNDLAPVPGAERVAERAIRRLRSVDPSPEPVSPKSQPAD